MTITIGTSTSAFATDMGGNVSITFASNGTAFASYYDGSKIQFAYASSPYTSWTLIGSGITASGMMVGTRLDTSNTVNTGYYISTGIDYAPVTLSGTTYSLGTQVQIASGSTGGNALMGGIFEKDPQSRYWFVTTNRAGSSVLVYTTTTPGTAGWTSNHTVSWSSGTLNNWPVGGIVGNYLLFLYPSATSTFDYQRLDIHNVSLGSWSSATGITPGGSSLTNNNYFSFRGNSTVGVMANDSGSGIWARVYTPGTDTWASAVQLSSGASDAKPSVIAGADGNLYVFWQSFIASNNYAIVWKMYNVATSTWDSSPTTLVASGANNFNLSGGAGTGIIGVMYQSGTASPYNVNFAALTTSSRDVTTRFRLMSASQLKDIATRFILAAGGTSVVKDIMTRFRQMSAGQLRDVVGRFRQMSAGQLRDVATRFRQMSASQRKDVVGRFRLALFRDVATRFRQMSATQFKDISTRFRLFNTTQLKDIITRFRQMSANQLQDIATRFRQMSASQRKDIVGRFRQISANQRKDVVTRFRQMSASQLRDVVGRFRQMSASRLKDLVTRFSQRSANTFQDIVARFLLEEVGGVILPPPPSVPYTGGTVLPLISPAALYMVNGTLLDVQPTLCTTPISTAPILAGTSFCLGFSALSTMLQTLFVVNAQLLLQIPLSDGSQRSVEVLITEVNTSGSQLLVTCTLLHNSSAYVWVLPVQV